MNMFVTNILIETVAKIVKAITPNLPEFPIAAPEVCCNECEPLSPKEQQYAQFPTLRPILFAEPWSDYNSGYGLDDFVDYTWVQCSDCGEFTHAYRIDANGRCGECFKKAITEHGDDAFPF